LGLFEVDRDSDHRHRHAHSGLARPGRDHGPEPDARLARVQLGNLGHCEPVGEGVMELKIDYGPGYRVYFGQVGPIIVLLLCGGDERTQQRDNRSQLLGGLSEAA
jgi:putative addiction module killer protein